MKFGTKKLHSSIYTLILISVLTSLLFSVKEALAFLPNIELVTLLLCVYTKFLGIRKTTVILILYILLEFILYPMSIFYIATMFLAWFIWILYCKLISKKIWLIVGAIFHGFLYGILYMIPTLILVEVNLKAYWISDLPFEAIMAASGAISIAFLYTPLMKSMNFLFPEKNNKEN